MQPTSAPDGSLDSPASASSSGRAYGGYVCYAALLVALAAFGAVRFHFRNLPLERDEGEYAYIGQLILQGVAPFKIAYTMKLPGTALAYAVMMSIFGQTSSGIHTGMIFVTTACAWLVFLLGKKLYGLLAGTIAGITYIFLAIRPGVLGIDGHATHFVVLMALAGILILFRAIEGERIHWFFLSGLMFGLAFLMKQPGIFFGIFAGSYWLWCEWKREFSWKDVAQRGAALTLGTLLPYAAVCLWMWHAGVFANFWFWTWTYAREYGSITSLSDSWRLVGRYTIPWALKPYILLEIALAGLVAPLWSRAARRHGAFLAGFFLVSCAAVCPGLYFRPHYFILLLPACALCVGVTITFAQHELRRHGLLRWASLPVLLFAVAYVVSIHGQWKTYFRLSPDELSTKMYNAGQAFPEDAAVSDIIKPRAKSGDQIGIFGSEPEICFYTRLHCTSGYLYMYPLLERQKYAGDMQREMMQKFEASPPRFIVYLDDSWSWSWHDTLTQNRPFFDWAWNFTQHGYRLVNEIPVPDADRKTEHLWGERASFYVFERTGQ